MLPVIFCDHLAVFKVYVFNGGRAIWWVFKAIHYSSRLAVLRYKQFHAESTDVLVYRMSMNLKCWHPCFPKKD